MNNNYAGLHIHDQFSLMDGVATADEYAQRALDIGMTTLAQTNHGTLSGHRIWHRTMNKYGIKPILGIEGYITADRFDKRDKKERTDPLDVIYNHIVILAKNDVGLENLGRLNEIAWNEGFYRKPRIDFELLEKYREGLIVTSACMSGLINKAIEVDDYAAAKSHLKWFGDRFGEDFYVEVMPHNVAGMNKALIDLADAAGHKLVVTPDCHHATVDQKVIQEIMLINNTHAKLQKEITYDKSRKIEDPMKRLDYLYGEDRMMSFNKFDIHLLSGDEMHEAMGEDSRPDMFANTIEVAEKIEEYTIHRNLNLLPVEHKDPDKMIRKYAESFLKEKGLDSNQEYVDRLNEELDVIKQKSFASYFLVVQNMLNWAKKNDIMVGPGRGSSAGSLLCFALGITDIDPIEHGLLFFRFLDVGGARWDGFSGFTTNDLTKERNQRS